MNRFWFYVFVVLGLVLAVWVLDPPPIPLPKTVRNELSKPEKGREKSKDNHCGTESSPCIVKLLPSVSEDNASEEKAEQEYEKAKNERLITRSTAALAVVTLFLAIFTFQLWMATKQLVIDAQENSSSTIQIAQTAADAAKASATTALTAVYLKQKELEQWIEIRNWKQDRVFREPNRHCIYITFDIVNPTAHTLTFNKVVFSVGTSTETFSVSRTLQPNVPYTIDYWDELTPVQNEQYLDTATAVRYIVKGKVYFTSITGNQRTQPFGGELQCGKSNYVRFTHNDIVEQDAQQKY